MGFIADFLSQWFSPAEITELEQYPSEIIDENEDIYNHELGTDEETDDNHHDYADDDGDGDEDDQSDYEDEREDEILLEGGEDDGLFIDPTQDNGGLHMAYVEDEGISDEYDYN